MFRLTLVAKRLARRAVMVVGAMGNTASTPQASCGHIGIVRSILSASPCAVPTSSHMDCICLSSIFAYFRGLHPNMFHVPYSGVS